MRKYRCSIDWDENLVHLGTNATRVTLPMVMGDELNKPTPSSTINDATLEPSGVLFVKGLNDHEASTSKASVRSTKDKLTWPQRARQPKPTELKKRSATPSSQPTKLWIPKTVLKAQGYYQGTKLVWICLDSKSKTTDTTYITYGVEDTQDKGHITR